MNQEKSACKLLVIRAAGLTTDGWDRRAAVVAVDGVDRAELHLEEQAEFWLAPGKHEIAIRLLYHFAPASITVALRPSQTTTVTCSKGSATFLDLLNPRQYWQLTETVDQSSARRSRFEA